MRVVLEVCDGLAAGRKIWLLTGQTVHVGRSDASDFVISEDRRLSGRHFLLDCQPTACRLRDLNSTNGTLVNGNPVREQELRHGDEIVAGQTRFAVSIVSDLVDAAPRTLAAAPLTSGEVADKPTLGHAEPLPHPASRPNPLPVLLLDVESKGAVHRRIWLRPEGSVSFGRSRQSDESFPHDPGMSGRHFVIEPTPLGWRCRDLDSTNGTFLNDAPIAEVVIHAGDRINAGNTTFVVDFPHGTSRPASATLNLPGKAGALANADRYVARPPRAEELAYRKFCGRSGLVLFLGQTLRFTPDVVARALGKLKPPLLIADRELAETHVPAAEKFPITDAASVSQRVMVGPVAVDEAGGLVAAAWGHDSTVLCWSASNDSAAVDALRAFSRAAAARSCGDTPLAELRPVALAEFLLNSPPIEITGLFPVLSLLFLETHQGDRWGVLGPPSSEPVLQQCGLNEAPAWRGGY